MDKIKVFAICGKAGSGKDTVKKHLFEKYNDNSLFHSIIPCTTRPMRQGESQGNPYLFLSHKEFTEKVLNGNMIEATSFRDWFYGTELSALQADKINVGIFSLEAIDALIEDSCLDVTIIYVYASDKIRLLRQLNRESFPDCLEIIRRFQADEKDFAFIDEYNSILVTNEKPNMLDHICEKILSIINCQK